MNGRDLRADRIAERVQSVKIRSHRRGQPPDIFSAERADDGTGLRQSLLVDHPFRLRDAPCAVRLLDEGVPFGKELYVPAQRGEVGAGQLRQGDVEKRASFERTAGDHG